jgi:hypothetical protein
LSEITELIDQRLAEMRPDRYETAGGDEWLDLIADEVADFIPEAEARQLHASKLVRDRERRKTSKTNDLLREVYRTGQAPLAWFDVLHTPLAVGKERVALRAATSKDFRTFATEERKRAANDFSARNDACEGAELIADQMDAHGWRYGGEVEL